MRGFGEGVERAKRKTRRVKGVGRDEVGGCGGEGGRNIRRVLELDGPGLANASSRKGKEVSMRGNFGEIMVLWQRSGRGSHFHSRMSMEGVGEGLVSGRGRTLVKIRQASSEAPSQSPLP